jgi:tRNA(Ile)-lysidine synthase
VLERFKQNCIDLEIINKEKTVALAISGGKDSVFCAYMLNLVKIPFTMVHCNFKLRGAESDGDEKFIESLSTQLEYCSGFYSKSFETQIYSNQEKISIQEAARNLRYTYFEELKNEKIFDLLITCHHKSDVLETFFINLMRVSGIKGLKSIPRKREFLVRPMLNFSSSEIKEYITKQKIEFREDSSNESNNYLRNRIRNKIIPLIRNEVSDFENQANKSINILTKQEELFQYLVQKEIDLIADFQDVNSIANIDINRLLSYPQPSVLLYSILDKFGFNHSQCEQIIEISDSESGKFFESNNYVVLVDREHLILNIKKEHQTGNLEINGTGVYKINGTSFELKKVDSRAYNNSSDTEYIELNEQDFPLILRHWIEGDYIYPLGMKGKKLISDFFIDHKINQFEKHQTYLLATGQEIIWICGYRISENFKVTSGNNIYQISILK